MVQPYLYMRANSTAHAQVAVFKEINMQLVQVGSDFGTVERTVSNGYQTAGDDRVIHWENDLYCVNGNTIYKYDVANSGDWDVFYTYAAPDGVTHHRMGLVACSINGSGLLCTAFSTNASNQFRVVKIDKDLNVVEGPVQTRDYSPFGSTSFKTFSNPTSYRNNLVWHDGFFNANNGSAICVYDLETDSLVQPTQGLQINGPKSQLVIHQDKIFGIFTWNSSGDVWSLWRVDGSVMLRIHDFVDNVGNGGDFGAQGGGSAFIALDGKLYAIFITAATATQTDGTWVMKEITVDSNNNFVSTVDVSSKLPSSLTSTTNRREQNALFRMDNLTKFGVNPDVELLVGGGQVSEGVSRGLYRWENAPSGNIVFVDNGLDAWRFTHVSKIGGDSASIWSGSGTINASQPCLNLQGTNITAKFKVWGASQTGVSAQLLFATESDPTMTEGTLDGTDAGSLNGNIVEGLTADGTTEVTVSWAAAFDGVLTGDNPKVSIRVFI